MKVKWTDFDTTCWKCGKNLTIKEENRELRKKEFEERMVHLEFIEDSPDTAYLCDDCDKLLVKWLESLTRCPKCNEYLIDFQIKQEKVYELCFHCGFKQVRESNDYWDIKSQSWQVLNNKSPRDKIKKK